MPAPAKKTVPYQQVLCRLDEIPEGCSKGFAADSSASYADILIVRTRDGLYAYRNRCPHTGAPMEWQDDQFLDYEGHYIQCGIHAALFRIDDGYCIAGPCIRRSLQRVEVEIRDGLVVAVDELTPQVG